MSLINNRVRGFKDFQSLQSAVVATGLFAVLLLLDQSIRGSIHVGSYKVYCLLIVGAIGLHALMLSDRRRDAFGIAVDDDVSAALGKTLFVSFVLFAYLAATKDGSISRVFLFTYLALLFVVLLVSRKLSARLLGPLLFNSARRCGTIVVGGTRESERAAAWVESKASLGMETLGWLPTSQQDAASTKLPKLGNLLQLEEILRAGNTSVVLVADFLKARVHLAWLRSVCDRYGVRLAFNVDFGESMPCSISCYQDGDINVVTLRDEPLESPFNRTLKRLLDIAIAVPVIVLILPVLAAIVRLAHLRQAPGPLFFRQQRVGLRGKSFSIYKFRTMYVDNPNEAVQVDADDDRIFPAGKWFRQLSVDEFPQFINVLQGNMSIVGPRPHMELHDSNFAKVAPVYKLRSFIKPGITGLAQVRGFRGPTTTVGDVEGRAKSDLYYVENWSLKMDVVIIARTLLQFLRRCGS